MLWSRTLRCKCSIQVVARDSPVVFSQCQVDTELVALSMFSERVERHLWGLVKSPSDDSVSPVKSQPQVPLAHPAMNAHAHQLSVSAGRSNRKPSTSTSTKFLNQKLASQKIASQKIAPQKITDTLTSLIQPDAILAYCSEPRILGQLNARHLALALNRIAKHNHLEPVLGDKRLGALLSHLIKVSTSSPKTFDAQALSNTTHALVKLSLCIESSNSKRSASPDTFIQNSKQVYRLRTDFWKASFGAIACAQFKPQHIANYAWGIAKTISSTMTTAESRMVLNMMCVLHELAVVQMTKAAFKPQEVANIIWAFAKVSSANPTEFRERLSRSSTTSIISTHTTSTQAAIPCSPLGALCNSSITIDESFSPQHLANIAWAFAKTKHSDHAILSGVIEQSLKHGHRAFKSQEMSMLLWSLATISLSCDQQMFSSLPLASLVQFSRDVVIHELSTRSHTFTNQAISNIIWALAVLSRNQEFRIMTTAPNVCSTLVFIAQQHAGAMNLSELGMTCWGLIKLFVHIPDTDLAEFFTQTIGVVLRQHLSARSISKLPDFPIRELATISWAVVAFSHDPVRNPNNVQALRSNASALCESIVQVLIEQPKTWANLTATDIEMILRTLVMAGLDQCAVHFLRVVHQGPLLLQTSSTVTAASIQTDDVVF